MTNDSEINIDKNQINLPINSNLSLNTHYMGNGLQLYIKV